LRTTSITSQESIDEVAFRIDCALADGAVRARVHQGGMMCGLGGRATSLADAVLRLDRPA
jgi:hypothetical protein